MYADICSTHEFSDRVRTVEHAKDAGLSPCSGVIVGMGESHDDLIDAVFALRELGSDSIPVNFLMPFEGTPLEGTWLLDPGRLPAHPGPGPLRLPRHRAAHGRRAGDAPAHAPAAGPARGQLPVPGRLPHQRGPGGQGRSGHDRGQRLRGPGQQGRPTRQTRTTPAPPTAGPSPSAAGAQAPPWPPMPEARPPSAVFAGRTDWTTGTPLLIERDRGLLWHPYAPLGRARRPMPCTRRGHAAEPHRRGRAAPLRPWTP